MATLSSKVTPSGVATAAQGTLADTAVQPADNISTLTNDAGYLTPDSTDTLTNKTLTAPVINGAVSGDSLSTQAEAEAGTNNDQLMTPLRTAQAIDALAAGGATTFISRAVISSGTTQVVFTGFDSSLYESYIFTFGKVHLTAEMPLAAELSDNGGATYPGVYYESDTSTATGALNLSVPVFTTNTSTTSGVGNASTEGGVSGQVALYSPHLPNRTSLLCDVTWTDRAGALQRGLKSYGTLNSTVNAIKFYGQSTTLKDGTISMYGVKNS